MMEIKKKKKKSREIATSISRRKYISGSKTPTQHSYGVSRSNKKLTHLYKKLQINNSVNSK